MNRRAFLGTMAATFSAFALDPELLLWRPGAKKIFLPTPRPQILSSGPMTRGDMFTIDGLYGVNPVTGEPSNFLQRFVVTDDVTHGPLPMSVVYPRIVTEGVYVNVHATPQTIRHARPIMWVKGFNGA